MVCDLPKAKCKPCEGGTPPLSSGAAMARFEDWIEAAKP